MIKGIVNADFEAIISLSICDSDGKVYTQDAIIDTGFNGWLSLLNVTVDEIQRDPLKYLRQVEAGETIVIVRSDQAIAEIRPIASSKQLRPFGLCAGEFTVPNDFDAPLPEDLLSAFEGK
jgi:antitoxin (DNA-binding transcriptional repressor) of toxin-antitoxin stability system